MADVIISAGLEPSAPATSSRREAIKLIRATLRKQDSSDEEVDEALEALVELSKTE